MATIIVRALGVPGAAILVAGCAGNLQIPPPGPDNPGNAAAGSAGQPRFETVLSSGPAAPVPGAIDARRRHDNHGPPASADDVRPEKHDGGHEGTRHAH